jgi:hypothetical protein
LLWNARDHERMSEQVAYLDVLRGLDPATEQICSRCRRARPFSEFPPHPLASNGLYPTCRECHAAATREWRAQKPRVRRRLQRRPPKRAVVPHPRLVWPRVHRVAPARQALSGMSDVKGYEA